MTDLRTTLLVAIGDDDSSAALAWAVDRAARSGQDLRLVHVAHGTHGLAGPESLLLSFEAAELAGRQIVRAAQERALDAAEGRFEVDVDVPVGGIVSVLTDLAGSHAGVVLQHRRRTRVGQVLAGSVTSAVAARAAVPVVSVPDGWSGPAPAGNGVRSRVVVGIEDLDGADDLMAHAVDLATRTHADLTLLHAWDVPTAYELSLLDPEHMDTWRAETTQALEGLAALWRDKAPDVGVDARVTRGRPAEVLTAVSHDCDLLLVGHAHHRVPGHHLGSVARAVLRESACPVEIVPVHRERESS
ncbi:universal stress protein [Nocardioides iriomotensis]|uniref:Universal stress protein n=1 Tax=Nocardioides iriomotensis TaxID=715784 RepID=A0A4Q5IZ86_9ACTN|nr:universal stress protein [Nocardioides iriomotensis]RYU11510.1 universal stress protein [Nocardioides iriomotensis]